MTHSRSMSADDLLSTAEAATAFGVSRETVRRWAEGGKLPVISLPSGRYRFRRGDIEAILKPTTITDGAA